jgi:hypothetical protein
VKTAAGSSRSGVALAYRPARPDEVAACEAIWRVSINDYIVPLGQFEIPAVANPAIRLFTHLQTTDPERFLVATVPDGLAVLSQRHGRNADCWRGGQG